MVTANAASAVGAAHFIGSLKAGYVTDIAIYNGATNAGYRAVIDAQPQDVVLVLRGGKPLYGDLALMGISTSMHTPWFTAYGRVGATQLARVRSALADPRLAGKCRVVAIHHPPAGKRAASSIRGLKDRADFAEVIKECGADVVIHGHEHRNMRELLDGPAGPIEVLGVPSGTYEANDPNRTARYRIFEIEGGRVVGQHLRIWHRDRKMFARDEHEPPVLAASA